MKGINKYILVALVFVLGACDKLSDFGDTNVPTTSVSTPFPNQLFTSSQRGFNSMLSDTQGTTYVQQLSNKQYTSADNYQTVNFGFEGFYTWPLADLQKIIALNTDEDSKGSAALYGPNESQIAMAQILRSYIFLHITDRWGMIPYTEALGAFEDPITLTPSYDDQEDIYIDVFDMLAGAISALNTHGDAFGDADVMFGGDADQWILFANRMRAVAALRISKANPTLGQTEFAKSAANIVGGDQYYKYIADANNQNPWYGRFLTRRDWTVANTLVDYMQSTANGGDMDVAMDPRLPVFADPTVNTGEYIGMPFGLSEADAGAVPQNDVSFLGIGLRETQEVPVAIYTDAQMYFSLAEAREMGWINTSTTQAYYEAGIQASLTQYGVDADYATFITNSEVAFDGSRALEQIGNQKWVALFLSGYEAWAEWRRTGYPALTPAGNALNESKEIPVRQGYPVTERDLNPTSYNAAVAAQGKDGLDTKVWWNK